MYAQILKDSLRVNLVGGINEGLPIEHPSVICIDIGYRTDVKVGMKYDEETGEFSDVAFTPSDPVAQLPSIEDRVAALEDALLMLL